MAAVLEHEVTIYEPAFYRIDLSDDIKYINCSPEKLRSVIVSEVTLDYYVYEFLGEAYMPYLIFSGDILKTVKYFTSTIKRLYNISSEIFIQSIPDDANVSTIETIMNLKPGSLSSSDKIYCMPFVRINKAMMSEINDLFSHICKSYHVSYTPQHATYIPLNWPLVVYKNEIEVDYNIEYGEHPSVILSTMMNNIPIAVRSKISTADSKRAALVDSIMMKPLDEIKTDIIKATELVKMLNIDRSRDMNMFVTIGRCLYSIFNGKADGIEVWRSCTIPDNQDLCDNYWPSLDTTGTYYTIRTIAYLAKMDSPQEYKEWNSISVAAAIEASVLSIGGNADIAEVAYRLNPILFICDGDNPAEAQFYKFNGTYYKECGIFSVQDYLGKDVVSLYTDFHKDLVHLLDSNADNSFRTMQEEKIKKCRSIITQLKSDSGLTSIVKVLMRRYNKVNFPLIRDSNPNITVFEDCVFDAEKGIIRDGIPEDYCTVSTGYSFKEEWEQYNWNHPDVEFVTKNLEKIIYDSEKRELMRREFASRLHASNPRKRALVVQGPTNNGKSILVYYQSLALGQHYCPDVPNNTMYSKDSEPGAPSPQIEMLRNARVLPQMEITDEHTLNESLMKRLTGCTDRVTFRALYGKKIKSFIPRAVPFTVCNTFPKMNGNSAALRTRTVVVILDAKFITQNDPEWEQVKNMNDEDRGKFMLDNHWHMADTNFADNVKRTYKAFMWIMIQDYMKYSKYPEGVVPSVLPASVIDDTEKYFTRSNIYLQFMKSCTKRDPNAAGCSLYELHSTYRTWYQDNIHRFGASSLTKFKEELEAMGIKTNNDIYKYYTITYRRGN